MKVVCVDNISIENLLTIGKVYEGNLDKATWFTVTDDKGKESEFYEWRFSTIQNWREKQLDKILI